MEDLVGAHLMDTIVPGKIVRNVPRIFLDKFPSFFLWTSALTRKKTQLPRSAPRTFPRTFSSIYVEYLNSPLT